MFVCDIYLPGSDLHNISGLIKPVSIAFPLTRPSSGTYVCKYWDTETSQWLTDGVTTVLQTSSTVVCNSTHLTGFGVSSESTIYFSPIVMCTLSIAIVSVISC